MIRDEFDFINKIKPKFKKQSQLIKGIGDDAAVFSVTNMFDELICMDTMVEGVHFTRSTMQPYMIGFKALAVNISDIAAMGGIPTYYLVSIAVPKGWSQEELEEIYKGMTDLGNQYAMDLIGGDTVSSKKGLIVTVTVCGKIEKGKSLYRGNARSGDVVFVVGELGASAAGLEFLLENGLNYLYTDIEKKIIRAHQLPEPQVKAGRILANSGQRISLNDISDGLASEANEIAEASNVVIELFYEDIPKSSWLRNYPYERQKKWCLFGGEDYQLIGTMPREAINDLNQMFVQDDLKFTIIGEVVEGESAVYIKERGIKDLLPKKGFNHFN